VTSSNTHQILVDPLGLADFQLGACVLLGALATPLPLAATRVISIVFYLSMKEVFVGLSTLATRRLANEGIEMLKLSSMLKGS